MNITQHRMIICSAKIQLYTNYKGLQQQLSSKCEESILITSNSKAFLWRFLI